jgi:UDPglucose 6-dehydrogenase
MKNIAVIGTGYVGLVSGTCFAEVGNRVVCCDIDKEKIARLNAGENLIYEPGLKELIIANKDAGRLFFSTEIGAAIQKAEVVYIAVGTPMAENGEADLTYVRNAARMIGEHMNGYKVIVNKSTVPVGTGQIVADIIRQHVPDQAVSYDVVSNPEFLREGSAVADTFRMERAVIGTTSEQAGRIVAELHEPFDTEIVMTNVETAEMIKYAANAFLATKISFINDMANVCERVGANVSHVAYGMGLDRRIGPQFLHAGIGYGGSCFPKDTQALVRIAEKVGYDLPLLRAVIETNDLQRQLLISKLKQVVHDLHGKTIAVLGLAFKPHTDDIRYAPALSVIPRLLQEGARIKAYDPVAVSNAKNELPGGHIDYFTDVYEAITDADACLILTDWPDVVQMDLSRTKQLLHSPIVIDGRNCFDLSTMKSKGFMYDSIGRPAVNLAVSQKV